MRSREMLLAFLAAFVLSSSKPALADSCSISSQCQPGLICWGGQCVPPGSPGQTPSPSGAKMDPVMFVIGVVIIVGIIYEISLHSGPNSTGRELPPAMTGLGSLQRQRVNPPGLTFRF
jgi:hypothetical protein